MLLLKPLLRNLVISIKDEDWPQLANLVRHILNVYEQEGPEAVKAELLWLVEHGAGHQNK